MVSIKRVSIKRVSIKRVSIKRVWLAVLTAFLATGLPASAGNPGLLGLHTQGSSHGAPPVTSGPRPHRASDVVTYRMPSGSVELVTETSAASIHDPGRFLYHVEVRLRDGAPSGERISDVSYAVTSSSDFQPVPVRAAGTHLWGRAIDGFRVVADVTLIRNAGGADLTRRVVRIEAGFTSWSPR